MRPFQFNRVHLFCLAMTCAGVALAGNLAASEIEPYEGRVTSPRALILSGPGEKFYPTGTLVPGDIVEVYREADGWLGIRPPKGSFSLIPEKELTSRNSDLAEVGEDDVSSRIGSQLSDRSNAVQVRLNKGEVVEVLGRETIDGETWVKIAPPAGEFRWIHAASVERRGPISETATSPEDDRQVVPAAASGESVAIQSETNVKSPSTAAAATPPANDETWRASSAPVAAATPATTPMPEVVPPPLAPVAPPVTTGAATASTTAPPPIQNVKSADAPVTPVGFDIPRQLTEIEMRLSRMASAPPHLWNTERLQRDTQQLLTQAKTGAERDAIKLTMTKVDQFTVLARRYQQTPANRSVTGQAITPLASAAGAGAGTAALGAVGAVAGVPADGRYDAVGILRPVVSKRPGAPQFALVDERGQVVTFVTPTPDVNLQPYLGRRVGIAGNRGFIPEFNRAHVTAGRVTPLSSGTMR